MAEINTKQLYELINGDYKKVNPLVVLRDIIETVSGKDVEFVLTNYNHFNVNWSNTLEETRNQVPEILRRHNFWLSYNDGERQITERFIGDNDEAADTAEWTKDEHWQKIDFELLLTGVRTAVREMFEDFDQYPKVIAVFDATIKEIFTYFDNYPQLKAAFIEIIKEIFRLLNSYTQLKQVVIDTIKIIFVNINDYTQLKNIVIDTIKNIFTNVDDYVNLKNNILNTINNVFLNIDDYTTFKTRILEKIDAIFSNIDSYNQLKTDILNLIDSIFTNIDSYTQLKNDILNLITGFFTNLDNKPQLKNAVQDAIKYVFTNINNYPQTSTTIQNEVDHVLSNLGMYEEAATALRTLFRNYLANTDAGNKINVDHLNMIDYISSGTNITLTSRNDGGITIGCAIDTTLFKVVQSLPTTPSSADINKIFVVPNNSPSVATGSYVEYYWNTTKNAFEEFSRFGSNIPVASSNTNGLMSIADKQKLDGIANNANNYSLPAATNNVRGGVTVGDNISLTGDKIHISKQNVINALGYTPPTQNTTYSDATQSEAGLMSASDKQKLDGIERNAKNTTQYWKRNGTTLSPLTDGDNIDTTGVMYHSDVRLKENIKEVSSEDVKDINKIKFYHYNFIQGDKRERSGVIAQELIKAGFGKYVDDSDKDKYSVDMISILCDKIAYLEQEIYILKHGNL